MLRHIDICQQPAWFRRRRPWPAPESSGSRVPMASMTWATNGAKCTEATPSSGFWCSGCSLRYSSVISAGSPIVVTTLEFLRSPLSSLRLQTTAPALACSRPAEGPGQNANCARSARIPCRVDCCNVDHACRSVSPCKSASSKQARPSRKGQNNAPAYGQYDRQLPG